MKKIIATAVLAAFIPGSFAFAQATPAKPATPAIPAKTETHVAAPVVPATPGTHTVKSVEVRNAKPATSPRRDAVKTPKVKKTPVTSNKHEASKASVAPKTSR